MNSVLLLHHWMEQFRGGEAVLEQFGLLFPKAPIAVLAYSEQCLPHDLRRRQFFTSAAQKFDFTRKHFRKFLPLFPELIRTLRVPKDVRFVLSSDASLIKGVRLPAGAKHVCYCHSPPRYLWGLEESYLKDATFIEKIAFRASRNRLKRFDYDQAQKVDHFIANSRCVQERIQQSYNRDSTIIYPPVNVDRFDAFRNREDFYLVVSALVPYKRVELAVEACSRLGRKLIVIGSGPQELAIKRLATKYISVLGWQPDEIVQDHLERCRAFIFPGIEDFGIAPCEAQAAGAPVIAFAKGGALETVRDGVSGMFFNNQTSEDLANAILQFERLGDVSPKACRNNVLHLNLERFRNEIRQFLLDHYPTRFSSADWRPE